MLADLEMLSMQLRKGQRVRLPQKARGVKTEGQQTCPTDAITFGNLKDPRSPASQARRDERLT